MYCSTFAGTSMTPRSCGRRLPMKLQRRGRISGRPCWRRWDCCSCGLRRIPRGALPRATGAICIGHVNRRTRSAAKLEIHQQWKDVPRGTMDEESSHVCLNLSFKPTTRVGRGVLVRGGFWRDRGRGWLCPELRCAACNDRARLRHPAAAVVPDQGSEIE